MTLMNHAARLLCLGVLAMAAPVHGQPMNDGEACLEGSGRAVLDEAYCRRALSKNLSGNLSGRGLAAVERAALLTARARAKLGAREEAFAQIARALSLNPASAQAYFVRGVLASGPAAGLADLSRAVALNPYFADAFAHRGLAHMQIGAEAATQLDFDRALELRPKTSLALFAKGVLRFRQGRLDQARRLFEQVLRLSPVRHPIAALWLAATAAHLGGDPAAVLAPFLWWWEGDGWPAPLVGLWSGRLGPAAAIVAVMRQAGPVRAQGAFFVGQWYLAKGKDGLARQWLDRARALGPPGMMEVIALQPAASD